MTNANLIARFGVYIRTHDITINWRYVDASMNWEKQQTTKDFRLMANRIQFEFIRFVGVRMASNWFRLNARSDSSTWSCECSGCYRHSRRLSHRPTILKNLRPTDVRATLLVMHANFALRNARKIIIGFIELPVVRYENEKCQYYDDATIN